MIYEVQLLAFSEKLIFNSSQKSCKKIEMFVWQNRLKVGMWVCSWICEKAFNEFRSDLLWLWVFFFHWNQTKYICSEIRKSNVGLDRMKIRERDAESGTNLDPSSKSISSCWQFFPQMPFWSTTPQYSKALLNNFKICI